MVSDVIVDGDRPLFIDPELGTKVATRHPLTLVDRIMDIAAAHEDDLTRGLRSRERTELVELLTRIARVQDLIPTAHPDF